VLQHNKKRKDTENEKYHYPNIDYTD
ncbi:hypothetical protein LCGC14_2539850, partial [marine sediment metagenome]